MNWCACVAQYHIKPSGVSVGADKRIVCDGLSKGAKWAEQGRLGREQGKGQGRLGREQGKDGAGGRAEDRTGSRARTRQGTGQLSHVWADQASCPHPQLWTDDFLTFISAAAAAGAVLCSLVQCRATLQSLLLLSWCRNS